jgi:hypothetical protein
MPDPAFPTGTGPVLCCTNNGKNPYDNGPLAIGWVGALNHQDNPPGIKSYCPRINSAAAGDSIVTLKSAADATKIKTGRWHIVCGGCQQLDGYPPNVTYFDYAKAVSVSSSTVTLDRRLRYRYSDSWWEDVHDDQSFGVARLVPLDTGGAGGLIPKDPRITIRGVFQNVTFVPNPNGTPISYMQGFIDLQFDGCWVPKMEPSMCKHVLFRACRYYRDGEPDKIIETLTFDGVRVAGKATELGEGTGIQYWLCRNSVLGCIQVSPRQFRSLRSTFDASDNTNMCVPFSIAYNGPIMHNHFKGSTFIPGPNANTWTWTAPPYSPLRIGTDAKWSGNRLIVPSSLTRFDDWLNALYEGVILTTTGEAQPSCWGYVSNLTSPGDGTAIWADVVWVAGTKPLSGKLYPNGRYRQLSFDSDNTLASTMEWLDPCFMKESIPISLGPSYGFPAGYPVT